MYIFLDFVSELLERYSWIIVPSLIGALAIALVWRKVPKPDPALRETKIETKRIARMDRKVKRLRRKFDPARKRIALPDPLQLIVIVAGVLTAVIYLIISGAVKF